MAPSLTTPLRGCWTSSWSFSDFDGQVEPMKAAGLGQARHPPLRGRIDAVQRRQCGGLTERWRRNLRQWQPKRSVEESHWSQRRCFEAMGFFVRVRGPGKRWKVRGMRGRERGEKEKERGREGEREGGGRDLDLSRCDYDMSVIQMLK